MTATLKVVEKAINVDVWRMRRNTGIPVLTICDACDINPVDCISTLDEARRLNKNARRYSHEANPAINSRWRTMSEAVIKTATLTDLSRQIGDIHPDVAERAKAKWKRMSEELVQGATKINDLVGTLASVSQDCRDAFDRRLVELTAVEIDNIKSADPPKRFDLFDALHRKVSFVSNAKRLVIRAWAEDFPQK